MKKWIGATTLSLLCLALPVKAEQYRFTYSKLYYQLKVNQKEGHDDVRMALFFNDSQTGKACQITKAWMEKEEHYEEFTIPSNQELTLPIDDNLKSANPLVYIQTEEGKQCDISMEVLANQRFDGSVSIKELKELAIQMDAMFADIGGMFSSYFMPDVEGITFVFGDTVTEAVKLSNGKDLSLKNGRATVSLEKYADDVRILLPAEPLKVTPWLAK
ncbi:MULTISPECIES: DUF2987 domain-containing protein [Aliivibrio]|uniref:DUF2987 domain-containing protein n=1 Tax=Aliivibrio finisterrensis TaxID=511998 RepID=A0A4Q5KQD3_9GAMM|nr:MULTISPECIES: DUF2987 domain-containing protein [Aliivibrio]MDD9178732.1 DUF2987 domain-containing protein [Aliivibrio sp. A6]RYU48883.1 DUF2987 domain-containing protein [Aliivibrio finisterrensis]RYU55171.1 DUF2987 domain-containing protein [Aliivibrio finisterrensis]RYU59830.1 DUF2987 domain-containing protein [Aliivibrio finisterrensis]RYU65696.1 DUF2987 domain-containing protein [Aliivibrio finisterrensis]